MARGRMIDKRVGMSKKLGKASDKAARLWFMIYPHLDIKGRIKFEDLEDLKDEILPKFKNWTLKKVAESLNELADIELIILYPIEKEIAMQFLRFKDFQGGLRKDREADSKVPNPPEDSGAYRITPALSLSLSKRKEGRKEIIFSVKQAALLNITKEDMALWEKAYPACDIMIELHRMADWLISNPDKRKKNYRRFITNWLSRAQERGGTRPRRGEKDKKEIQDWIKKPVEKERK